MSAIDTAKEIVRIGSTAGLSKDVIDLLEKKAALLAEQVATLEKENTTLLRENRNLKLENENLQRQIPYSRPKGDGLEQKTQEILGYFFKQGREISEREIAQHFRMEFSLAVYHLGLLCEKKLIDRDGVFFGNAIGFGGGLDDGFCEPDASPRYTITQDGRKYIVQRGLAV
jgi:regulator of replication initiation timing